MRIVAGVVLLAAVALAVPVQDADLAPVLDDDLINNINSRNLGWKAGHNDRFEGLTMAEAKRLLGVVLPEGVNCPKDANFVPRTDLPDQFDSRKQWPGFIHGVLDQQQCGSCWAFAASEVLSDRLAIATNGSVNLALSPEGLVACDSKDMGCGGGWPTYAADFLVSTGIPSLTCEPYVSGGGSVPACPATCQDGTPKKLYKYKDWDYCIGEQAMMAALQNGPVAVAFAVYQDFFSYTSGVYKWDQTSGLAGYHAVKLLGYGTTGGPSPSPSPSPSPTPSRVDCDPAHPNKYTCAAGTTCCCDKRTFFTHHCEDFQCCATAAACTNPSGKSGCTKAVAAHTTAVKDAPAQKYWIVQNSWGTSWGIDGVFLIARGDNECGIEQGPLDRGCPLAGTPLV